MEVFFSVTPLCVQFLCPVCAKGYFIATGKQLMANPVRYEHMCNNDLCKQIGYHDTAYPQLRNVVNPVPLDIESPEQVNEKMTIIQGKTKKNNN